MADAGRILIIPKGNYNAEITYEVLDLVFNNGNSWLCKKTTKGIDPSDSNSEYWYKFTNFDSIIKNNVTTSEEGFALDARQGKVLMEAINGVSARVTSLSESTTASVSDLDAKINEAKNIAKGRNQARVFATTDAMKDWLKNAANKGMANQGDNLYIVTKDVPDYWVAEVLDTPNDEGYYYEVEELETQKVDLTTLNAAVDQLTNDIADVNGKLDKSTFDFDNRIMVTDNIFTCQTDGYLRMYAKYGSEYIVVSLNSQPVSCIASGNCSGNVNMYVKKGMTIKIQERSSTTNTDAFFVPLI